MKKSFKISILIIALVTITTIGVNGIFAYLTDKESVVNSFTIGNIEITLTEPKWTENLGTNTKVENIVPGQVIEKDPTITCTGNNPAYVYMKVEIPKVTLNDGTVGVLFTYTANEDWIEIASAGVESDTTSTKVYYYNKELYPEESATLFNTVTVADYLETIEYEHSINVYGYAIQSDNLPSGTTIESAYISYLSDL